VPSYRLKKKHFSFFQTYGAAGSYHDFSIGKGDDFHVSYLTVTVCREGTFIPKTLVVKRLGHKRTPWRVVKFPAVHDVLDFERYLMLTQTGAIVRTRGFVGFEPLNRTLIHVQKVKKEVWSLGDEFGSGGVVLFV